MWTSGVKKSINTIGRVWHLNLLKTVPSLPVMFFEVDEDLTDHTLSPGCHGQKNLNLGIFYLNYQPSQDKYLISDLFFEKKRKCEWFKKHLSKHPSSFSLKLYQMPALPPSQREFFMFSLQVTLSLSQTFSEAMGGELRLFVLVLLTVPTVSQLIHSHSGATGLPWPWNWLSLTYKWTWSLHPCTSGMEHHHRLFHEWICAVGAISVVKHPGPEQPDKEWGWILHLSSLCLVLNACYKGAGTCRVLHLQVNYHGWDSAEGPRLQMQRGWAVVFMLQLPCGLGMGSRHWGFCAPALQCKGCSLCCQ